MTTTGSSYLSSSHGGCITNNTDVSASTNGFFVDTSEPPHTLDVEPITGSSLGRRLLLHFEHHREDRLMGAFAGLALPHPPRRHHAYSGHMISRSTQDSMLFGIGAWTEEDDTRA